MEKEAQNVTRAKKTSSNGRYVLYDLSQLDKHSWSISSLPLKIKLLYRKIVCDNCTAAVTNIQRDVSEGSRKVADQFARIFKVSQNSEYIK